VEAVGVEAGGIIGFDVVAFAEVMADVVEPVDVDRDDDVTFEVVRDAFEVVSEEVVVFDVVRDDEVTFEVVSDAFEVVSEEVVVFEVVRDDEVTFEVVRDEVVRDAFEVVKGEVVALGTVYSGQVLSEYPTLKLNAIPTSRNQLRTFVPSRRNVGARRPVPV